MFNDTSFKSFLIDLDNKSIGKIDVNLNILNNKFKIPFIRKDKPILVERIGNRDYQKLDEFIIKTMNEYYNKMINSVGSEKDLMLNNYNHLYSIWRDLHNYKISKNIVEIDNTYDALLFELYLLGYDV